MPSTEVSSTPGPTEGWFSYLGADEAQAFEQAVVTCVANGRRQGEPIEEVFVTLLTLGAELAPHLALRAPEELRGFRATLLRRVLYEYYERAEPQTARIR